LDRRVCHVRGPALHASLGENAGLARQAGDQAGDRYWSALVTEVDDMIWPSADRGAVVG
jgi:hypothetical protein